MIFIAFYFGFFFLSILRFSHVEKWSKRKLLMAPIMYCYINDHGDNTTLRKERGTTHINSVPLLRTVSPSSLSLSWLEQFTDDFVCVRH